MTIEVLVDQGGVTSILVYAWLTARTMKFGKIKSLECRGEDICKEEEPLKEKFGSGIIEIRPQKGFIWVSLFYELRKGAQLYFLRSECLEYMFVGDRDDELCPMCYNWDDRTVRGGEPWASKQVCRCEKNRLPLVPSREYILKFFVDLPSPGRTEANGFLCSLKFNKEFRETQREFYFTKDRFFVLDTSGMIDELVIHS